MAADGFIEIGQVSFACSNQIGGGYDARIAILLKEMWRQPNLFATDRHSHPLGRLKISTDTLFNTLFHCILSDIYNYKHLPALGVVPLIYGQ